MADKRKKLFRQRTILIDELSNVRMTAGGERRIKRVIHDGVVKCWVGIGWVSEGPPTQAQERRLPHVREK